MSGSDKQSQLLADIEAFSRNGPVTHAEPEKPALHRETLAFPDLDKPAPPKGAPTAVPPAPTLQVPAGQASPAGPAAGSMLARLKQQAESLQQDAGQREGIRETQARQLSAAVSAAFYYLDDLIKQLNIIKPAIPKEFVFPGNIVFADMRWEEGAADFRMVPTASEDRRYDNLTLRFRIAAPRSIAVERDAIGIEPLRKTLHDYNVPFSLDEKLNARNQAERGRFTIPCEIRGGFLIKADYDAGNLLLRTRNVDRFGMMEFRLRAEDLDHATLDELAKLLLGEKSSFMQRFRRSA